MGQRPLGVLRLLCAWSTSTKTRMNPLETCSREKSRTLAYSRALHSFIREWHIGRSCAHQFYTEVSFDFPFHKQVVSIVVSMLKRNNLILFALYAFWMEAKEEKKCGKRSLCRVHKKERMRMESISGWEAVLYLLVIDML